MKKIFAIAMVITILGGILAGCKKDDAGTAGTTTGDTAGATAGGTATAGGATTGK